MPADPVTNRSIKALTGEIAGARDPQILRIVAAVDAMGIRGPADALIAPLRQRLSVLRPPRPLRFSRLLFHPLDSLIVPAALWRPGEDSIPRTALTAMAEHARRVMGQLAEAIEQATLGHTDAETDLVARLGQSLWPAAAKIFWADTVPEAWHESGLALAVYRPLADCIAALLDEAAGLEALCSETANGMLPVRPEAVGTMLDHVASANLTALPMLIAVILIRIPESAAAIWGIAVGSKAAPIRAAMDQAVGRVLRQLNLEGGTDDLIAAGTLADAGMAVSHIKTLLAQLDGASSKPQRREQLRAIRQRLDQSCKARFIAALEADLLRPLQQLSASPDDAAIRNLENAARGLRVLELEARAVGSGKAYDLLMQRATDAVTGSASGSHLAEVDQVRLVELLSGPDVALAMLNNSR